MVGERKNQTVLAAQLQDNRDKTTLQAQEQSAVDARDWARIGLQEKDSLREGNEFDRQADLAELEAQHRRKLDGRKFALDKERFGEEKYQNDVPYYFKTMSEQETALRNEQDYGLKVDEAIAKTQERDTKEDQWNKEFALQKKNDASSRMRDEAYAGAYGAKAAPDNAGQYMGVLRKSGMNLDNLDKYQEQDFLNESNRIAALPEFAGASPEEIAYAAAESAGISPSAQQSALKSQYQGGRMVEDESWMPFYEGEGYYDKTQAEGIKTLDPQVTAFQKAKAALPPRKPVAPEAKVNGKKGKKKEEQDSQEIQQALSWAQANPDDPRSQAILQQFGQ
jgi:hypothetical protein